MSQNKPELSKLAAIAVNDQVVYEKARDKLKTMEVCAELGLPHPRTLDAALPNLVERVRELGLASPLVVKPRKGFGAIGFRRVDRLEDLLAVVSDVAEKFGPPLVQEFIPQTDLQYKAQVMLDREGEACSCVIFSKVRWFPLSGGSSTLNVTVKRPDIQDTCVRLLKAHQLARLR